LDDPLSIAGGIVIALGLAMVFLVSLAEASLLAVSDVTLRRLAEKGNRRAMLIQRMREGQEYLSVIIVAMNVSVIMVSTVMTLLLHANASGHGAQHAELWHAGTILFILVFAELTPKTWGTLTAEKTALWIAPIIHYLTILTSPVVRIMTAISNLLLRAVGTPAVHLRHFVTPEEIQAAADISEEEGLVAPEEGEMLDSVMELKETTAREIMVPRVDVVAVRQDASLERAVTAVVETGYSRIPVYSETIDSITGVLYAKDVLVELQAGNREIRLADLVREPVFVPETKRVSELFRELRDQSVHIAVVVDEFGGTEGLVTLEDILEELVGEIEDEHDEPVEEITLVGEHEALADGKCRIEDVNECLNVTISEDEYETIGGFVTGEMGCIPEVGDKLESGPVQIIVEQGTDQHVERVRIILTDAEGSDK